MGSQVKDETHRRRADSDPQIGSLPQPGGANAIAGDPRFGVSCGPGAWVAAEIASPRRPSIGPLGRRDEKSLDAETERQYLRGRFGNPLDVVLSDFGARKERS
jgi:hypothetical protein